MVTDDVVSTDVLLGEFREMMNRQGADSAEVKAFLRRHKRNDALWQKARLARWIRRQFDSIVHAADEPPILVNEVTRELFNTFMLRLNRSGADSTDVTDFLRKHSHHKEFAKLADDARMLRREFDQARADTRGS